MDNALNVDRNTSNKGTRVQSTRKNNLCLRVWQYYCSEARKMLLLNEISQDGKRNLTEF